MGDLDVLNAFEQVLPGWSEEVMRTLENVELVATTGWGALLAPHIPTDSDLRENLVASVIADRMRLRSVDYTRRRYVQELLPHHRKADVGIVEAYWSAKRYMEGCSADFDPDRGADPRLGVFAASVALDRLPNSFIATKFLYQIGLHHEGDAVARQILEQVAWAVAAHGFDNYDELKAVTPTNMGPLKAIADHAGHMYGLLSDSTHMRLQHHRALYKVNDDGRGAVAITWKRERVSAQILLMLADLWVIAFEWTQFDYMRTVRALHATGPRRLRAGRPWITEMNDLVLSIPT